MVAGTVDGMAAGMAVGIMAGADGMTPGTTLTTMAATIPGTTIPGIMADGTIPGMARTIGEAITATTPTAITTRITTIIAVLPAPRSRAATSPIPGEWAV